MIIVSRLRTLTTPSFGLYATGIAQRIEDHHRQRNIWIAEQSLERRRHRAADRAVSRGILRMRGRGEERLPQRIRLREVIPADRAPSDYREGPPEVVGVFRVPAGDVCIRRRKGEERKRARRF